MAPDPPAEPVYDDYFWYAQNPNRRTWAANRFANLTKADVTCPYCGFVASSFSMNPKRRHQDHMRNNHRREYNVYVKKRRHIIRELEEPELPHAS